MNKRWAHLKVRPTLKVLKPVCRLVPIKQTGAHLELPHAIIFQLRMCSTSNDCGIVNLLVKSLLVVEGTHSGVPMCLMSIPNTVLWQPVLHYVLSSSYGDRRTACHVSSMNKPCSVMRYYAAWHLLQTTFKKVVTTFLDSISAID